MLDIRSNTWLADNLSWSTVVIELINAFDDLGHNTMVLSTNGMNERLFKKKNKMMDSVLSLQKFGLGKKSIDLDFCFTVPPNFPSRFLSNSKVKAAIYAYEYKWWPSHWKQYYKYTDIFFAPSDFAAEVFCNNDVPCDKVYVIEHGVNTEKFNPLIPPIKLKTKKSYRFLSVCAPHHRKKLHILLNAYCKAFNKKDDVCLVLKTKIYRHSDGEWNAQTNPNGRKGFEIVLGDIFRDLYNKYGKNIPEIEIIDNRIDNMGGLFNVCHTHISTPSSECFLIPALECMACGGATGKGMISIATNYSGNLQFMHPKNSLLINAKLVKTRPEEQYWGVDGRNMSAEPDVNHTAELMLLAYKEYDSLLAKFGPEMAKTVSKFSWINAAQKIIDVIDGRCEHYKIGTYGRVI
jgi:glycosyltransferase involved in cell wall biosynthesis